jgi:diguanylate cyclase (GGDEF)-like protein/PAS domain S-box-containing protein
MKVPFFAESNDALAESGLAREMSSRASAEVALRASERRLRAIIDTEPECVKVVTRDGRLVEMNPAGLAMLQAASLEEAQRQPLLDFIVPQHRADFGKLHKRVMDGESGTLRFEITGLTGARRWLETHAAPLRDDAGEVQALLGITRDITNMVRAERWSNAELRMLELLARGAPAVEVLESMCESIEVHSPGAHCSILLLDDAKAHLRHVAAPNLPQRYVSAIDGVAIGPNAGSCGTAAYLGKQIIVSDIATDPLWREYRDLALREGLRACWSTPVLNEKGQVLGTFAIYYKNPQTPTSKELGLIDRITNLASIVMVRSHMDETLRQSEENYRGLIEQASDGIFVLDTEGNYLLGNSSGCAMLGYSKEELRGLNGRETYLEDERELYAERMRQVRAGEVLRFERMVKRKDGSTFPAEVSVKVLDNGKVQLIFRDITTRRIQEEKIARLSRIHAVLSGINSAMVRIRDRNEMFQEACRIAVSDGHLKAAWIGVVDPVTLEGKVVAWAGNGESYVEHIRLTARAGTPYSDRPACRALREMRPVIVNDVTRDPVMFELRSAMLERGHRATCAFPLIVANRAVAVLSLHAGEHDFFDEAEMKLLNALAGDIAFNLQYIEQEEKATYLAFYDPLTGMANRNLFIDRLTHQLGAAARDKLNVALVLMNLERFRFNDTLGRSAGDTLLNSVAQRIRQAFRERDMVARVGADSFAVAISGAWQAEDAARVLEAHNRKLFGQPFLLGQEELRVSAVAGIAVFPGDGESAETLFANAEAALRRAKERNTRFLFYSPDMNARVADSLRLENRLRRALENGEMSLWYQPKVSATTGRITGLEALMRWHNPETGMVPPGKFIPLMEQTGLILDAGQWALSQVARDCEQWASAGRTPPRVAVNVSSIQLRQNEFVSTIVEAARNVREAGSTLDIEITESVIMENVEAIVPKIQTIRGLGVKISIDDFGTGYSSLSYIARLPIHALKIDRSFVVGMTHSEDSLAIVRSVISLAHALRLQVIAEGVESEAQSGLLRELACDEMQGYLFGRPLDPARTATLLDRQGDSTLP